MTLLAVSLKIPLSLVNCIIDLKFDQQDDWIRQQNIRKSRIRPCVGVFFRCYTCGPALIVVASATVMLLTTAT